MSIRHRTDTPSLDIIAQASEWFIEFRTTPPSERDAERFNEWLRTSPQHIQAYLEVAAGWTELPGREALERVDLEGLIQKARASAPNVIVHPFAPAIARAISHAPERQSRRVALAVAASVSAMLAGLLIWHLVFRAPTYSTDVGEQHSVRLADGSTIDINSRSTVEVRFSERERRVDLVKGQALFHVLPDKSRPFIVDSGDMQIRAVGTQFDVYRKPGGTVVTVIEGKVAVSSDAAIESTSTDNKVLLTAGERLTVRHDRIVTAPAKADLAAATAWTEKRLVFEDTPLGEAADEFNRYNTRQLHIDPQIAGVTISGLYSSTDPASLIAFLRTQPTIKVSEAPDRIDVAPR